METNRTPRRRIRRVSKARAKQESVYKARRRVFVERFPRCAVFPRLKTTDIHHIAGRHGKLLNQVAYWLPVSRKGHDWINTNMEASRLSFWQIHQNDKVVHTIPWLISFGGWLDPKNYLRMIRIADKNSEFCEDCGWVIDNGCRCFILTDGDLRGESWNERPNP